jgi:CRP/FNR family transcriptional regulator, cyclic AMP receptor protein
MTPSEASRIVRGVLCRGLSYEQTEQILKAMVPVKTEADFVVFKEGERPQGLMVLLEGTVEVFKDGGSEALATISAPTVLGEISLLTEGPHTASVRAKTACEFSLLTTTQFHRLLREESVAAYKVIATLAEVLARRLHRMDEKFVEVSRQSAAAHVQEMSTFTQQLYTDWNP